MTYNQAIEYCLKRISYKQIRNPRDYNRLKATKWKAKKGIAQVEAIYSMFEYFGIEDHSKYKVKGQKKLLTKEQALKWCFDQVSTITLTEKEHNRWYGAKKRWRKGELGIESTSRLFEFYGVERKEKYYSNKNNLTS